MTLGGVLRCSVASFEDACAALGRERGETVSPRVVTRSRGMTVSTIQVGNRALQHIAPRGQKGCITCGRLARLLTE